MQSNAEETLTLGDALLRDFDRIYRENAGYVFGLLRRFGASRPQAEDLAHDVFETLFYKLAALPPEDRSCLGRMRAYLFQITWQRLANHRRLHSVRLERVTDAEPERGVGPHAHEYVLARELARVFDTLDPIAVAVFVGFEVFGATVPELAEEHRMTEDEARTVLRQARLKVRRSICTEEGEGP